MNNRFKEQAKNLSINGTDPEIDASIYEKLSEEQLVRLGCDLFLYYLHDDYTRRFRKMLTIEQFHDKELADLYTKLYVDDPLSYQGMLLGLMAAAGVLHTDDAKIMTLHFYAPIYYLLTLCDRNPEREGEALETLEKHIKQFDRLYGRNN